MEAAKLLIIHILQCFYLVAAVSVRFPEPSEPHIPDMKAIEHTKHSEESTACYPFTLYPTPISQLPKYEFYKSSLNCVRLLEADAAHRVRVTFSTSYAIEASENCKYDSLTFQDGPFAFSPTIKKMCGSGEAGTVVTSSTRYMRIVFSTDDVIEDKGFRLSYEYVPIDECKTNPNSCRSCYYNITFSGQGESEISADSVANFYKDIIKPTTIDCVWDISSRDGKNVWIWVGEDIVHPIVAQCSERTIEIYSADKNRPWENFRPLSTGSSQCYLTRRKFFPIVGSPRLLVHVKSDEKSMPTIRFNFTTYTEPNPEPDKLCNRTTTYTCEDGRLCLDMDLVCNNGTYNCPDGDDESKEACILKNFDNGPSIGLQFIFIGAAVMFFFLVTIALFISAKRMIRENRKNEEERKSSTVIINHRPSRMFEQSTVRKLLDPLSLQVISDTYSHDSTSQNSRMSHCPYSARASLYSKRGSWFTNGSISNLSISSDSKLKCDGDNNSRCVSPLAFLSPDIYTNHIELKRLRTGST